MLLYNNKGSQESWCCIQHKMLDAQQLNNHLVTDSCYVPGSSYLKMLC